MHYRKFGSLSVKVSEVGFGTSQLANTNHKYEGVKYISEDEACKIISKAIEGGINFFDTGSHYGNSEALLGRFKRRYGHKILIATKVGMQENGKRDFLLPLLKDQVDGSLKKIGTDCLDILQLNKPSVRDLESGELFYFLDELKRVGKIKYAGVVVGDNEAGLICVNSQRVDCVQILYNLLYQDTEKLILKAHHNGLGVIIRSPLNSGVLSGTYTYQQTFDPNDERSAYFSGPGFTRRLDILQKIKKDLSVSNNDLLEFSLKFILSNSQISLVIPAASRLCQIERYLKLSEEYSKFSSKDLSEIKSVVLCHLKELGQQFQTN